MDKGMKHFVTSIVKRLAASSNVDMPFGKCTVKVNPEWARQQSKPVKTDGKK